MNPHKLWKWWLQGFEGCIGNIATLLNEAEPDETMSPEQWTRFEELVAKAQRIVTQRKAKQ